MLVRGESSVRTKIWKEIKGTQLKIAQSLYDNIEEQNESINTTYLSKILPFMKNYRKTDTTAICLPVDLIFQTQKLGRFLSWSSWSFKTISIQKVSYLELNCCCSSQLILFSITSHYQSNIGQIYVKNS